MGQEYVVINQERQERARAYKGAISRATPWISVVVGIFAGLVGSLFKVAVLILPIQSRMIILNLEPIPGWFPLVIFVDMVLLLVFILPFLLPLSWYIGLVLPRRYGFSKKKTGAWLKGFAKATLLQASQFLLLAECVFFFYALQPQVWWFWIAVIYALYLVARARLWVTYILPFLYPVKPLEMRGELTLQLRALMERLRYFVSGIFVIQFDTDMANAYYEGWGEGRYVLLTSTVLQSFSNDEIEVILAHELGHMVHHDIWKRIVLRSLLVLEFLGMVSVALPILIHTSIISNEGLILKGILWFLLMLGFGFSAQFCLFIWKRQEYQADEFALQATGKVLAFKNAMVRLSSINMTDANPSKKNKGMTAYPSLEERLLHADEFALRQRGSVYP